MLAAYKPLGVVSGEAYDPDRVARIDGKKFREVARRIFNSKVARPPTQSS